MLACALVALVMSGSGGERVAAQGGNLNGHPVRVDGTGGLLSWSTPQDRAYDQVMSLAWDFLFNRVPVGNGGYRYYYLYSAMLPDLSPTARNNNPGSMFPGFAESALRYYPYSANPAVMNLTRDVLSHYLTNGLTPSNWPWPNVPFATGENGNPTYGGDSSVDGTDVIQPDKVGMVGTAFLKYYLFSGDVRFRDAAINSANTLASRIRSGDATRSPWPFRVNARTQQVREEYSAHVIAPIELFDMLIARGLGNVAAYQTARQAAWNWMMQYPMSNNEWANYFEDVFVGSNTRNHTQLIALETARYLLLNTDKDPQWQAHVRGIIQWVEQNFAVQQHGANAIREQFEFPFVMGSHSARYASINAMLFEKTGDTAAKQKAYRSFNWATYMAYSDGRVIDGPDVNQIWFTDGYGDYLRHFMDGIAAVPEWAPNGQTHLLGSSSIVRTVAYATGEVTYQTVDPAATDVLRLAFTPGSVTVDGQPLQQRGDLTQPGWTYDASIGALRIRRTSGTNVRVSSSGGGPTPPVVTSVTPGNGAVVPVNSSVSVTFNEAIDPATIAGATFFVQAGGSPVAASVSYSASTRTATLTPSSPLAAGTTYTALVRGGATDPRVKDLEGTAMAANYTWTFSTAAPGGPTPPAVTTVTPASGAVVPISSSVGVTFNEDIDPATITGATFFLQPGSGSPVAATVSYAGSTRTATLTPSAPLVPGTSYTARVRGGATDPRVKDLEGTALATDYAWTFSTASATTPSGLVGAWSFNEGSGTTVADASGNNHGGTVSGATFNASGRYGSALSFDGTNDMVTVADTPALDLSTAMTLEAWVYPTALSGWRTVVMKESTNGLAWTLYGHDNAPRPAATINTGGTDISAGGAQQLPLNTWTFLAATYDGSVLRLFVNGIQVSTTSAGGTLLATAGALRFGGNAAWGEYFAGLIDEVRIYNRVLSAAEIQSDMTTPVQAGGPSAPAAPTSLRIVP